MNISCKLDIPVLEFHSYLFDKAFSAGLT